MQNCTVLRNSLNYRCSRIECGKRNEYAFNFLAAVRDISYVPDMFEGSSSAIADNRLFDFERQNWCVIQTSRQWLLSATTVNGKSVSQSVICLSGLQTGTVPCQNNCYVNSLLASSISREIVKNGVRRNEPLISYPVEMYRHHVEGWF